MSVKSDPEDSIEHSEELINDLEAANRRGSKPANKRGGLFLQAVSFSEPDRRQRDDEQGHQPVFGERPAKHVDDALLTRLCQEGKRLKDAFTGEEWQSSRDPGDKPRSDDLEGYAQSKGKPNDHDP